MQLFVGFWSCLPGDHGLALSADPLLTIVLSSAEHGWQSEGVFCGLNGRACTEYGKRNISALLCSAHLCTSYEIPLWRQLSFIVHLRRVSTVLRIYSEVYSILLNPSRSHPTLFSPRALMVFFIPLYLLSCRILHRFVSSLARLSFPILVPPTTAPTP